MLSAYVFKSGLTSIVGKTSISRTALIFSKPNAYNSNFRLLSNQTRNSFTRRATRSRTLKEIAMAPAGEGGVYFLFFILNWLLD